MSEGLTEQGRFERWLAGELRRPVAAERLRVERVMARVRVATPPQRRVGRDGVTSPFFAFSLAAGLVLAAVLPPLAGGGMAAVHVAVRDTTQLVRFVLVAPDAARVVGRVAIAGDARLVADPRARRDSAPDTSQRTVPDTTI